MGNLTLASLYGPMGQALARDLSGLPGAAMRTRVLAERLAQLQPLAAVWHLEIIIRGALVKDDACVLAYEAMIWPDKTLALLDKHFVGEMIDCGTDEGCIAAVLWLRSPGLGRRQSANVKTERLVALPLKDMTLGARRALARTAKGQEIKLLLQDPDAGVIHNLLNNPRVTQSDVLMICSRRPTVPDPLAAVLRSEKWGTMPWARISLARNPHLPVPLGLVLLPALPTKVLQELITDATLAGEVRLGAQHLLNIDLLK